MKTKIIAVLALANLGLRSFLCAITVFSAQAAIVLTLDQRDLTVSRGEEILGPGDGSRWKNSLERPYVSAGSGETTGYQVASQDSLFSPFRIEGTGGATTTYTPGHAGNGAEADSNLEFRFTVTQAASFRFSASCFGGHVNDNVSFSGPSPLGTIAHIHINEQASASGSLVAGNYILRARCHTQASDAWRDAGWQFVLNIGPPPVITVAPSPLDFGSVNVREERTLTLLIGNNGPADSVLAGTIYQPANLAFTVLGGPVEGGPIDFEVRPGFPLLVPVRVRAPRNPAWFDNPIVDSIPIHSGDATTPILNVPLVAFLKAPVPTGFRKTGVSLLNAIPYADRLQAQLFWESSSGHLSDLSDITIYEELRPTFGWAANADPTLVDAPPPFVFHDVPKDWSRGPGRWSGDGQKYWSIFYGLPTEQTGAGLDQHGQYQRAKPYVEAGFGLEQRYYWTAPWHPEPVYLLTDHINRAFTPAPGPATTLWFDYIHSDWAGEVNALVDIALFRHLKVTPGANGTSLTLRFSGEPGKSYHLQRADQPKGPWQTIQTVSLPSPGDGSIDVEASDVPAKAAFYRLEQ